MLTIIHIKQHRLRDYRLRQETVTLFAENQLKGGRGYSDGNETGVLRLHISLLLKKCGRLLR